MGDTIEEKCRKGSSRASSDVEQYAVVSGSVDSGVLEVAGIEGSWDL